MIRIERIVPALLGLALLSAGCQQRHVGVFPNSDPLLNKKPAEFSADAANRHPMKAHLPKAGAANAVAAIDYTMETVQLANLSDQNWAAVEVWINGKYVVYVPKIEARKLRTLNFAMFYDGRGNNMPPVTKQGDPRITALQILRDNAWYDVPMKLAE